jgi:apolipoprotein N-acyltransferase
MTRNFCGRVCAQLNIKSSLFLSFLAGALLPLSLAPTNFWPLAIASPAALSLLLQQKPKYLFGLCFAFGAGLFGVGASWVFVSIHQFGGANTFLAGVLTLAFSLGLALVFALPFLLLRWVSEHDHLNFLLSFACLWVLGEWIRSWLLTGFPWLFIGYSQLPTPLSGLAPIGGIYLVSLGVLLSSICITAFLLSNHLLTKIIFTVLVATFWITGEISQQHRWTVPTSAPIKVALIQANIAQEKKWRPEHLQPTLNLYKNMSHTAKGSDWIIWPEAAVPMLYGQALPFLTTMDAFAKQTNTALLTGILYDDQYNNQYHNSAVALGQGTGLYHKTRLVPFGEYVPLEDWLRGLIEFFNLPTSIISKGEEQQPALIMGNHKAGLAICYEIVYPDLVAKRAKSTDIIITLSNDAWFGQSWGPLQHLEMAQMRAKETGRYVIRGTNNGVSAIIKPDGSLSASSQQFVQEILYGEVQTTKGLTWFVKTGSYPVIIFCILGLLASIYQRK